MIELKDVSFTYNSEGSHGGVQNIHLTIPDGQVVVLCGESGCGKTTLTRLINGLIPHYFAGSLTGSIVVNGKSIPEQPLYDTATLVGSVFQNPRSQFFNVDTTSELSFGCENLGMPKDEILRCLQSTASALHIEKLFGCSIFDLSGGEKQRLALASAMAAKRPVVFLDEPTSGLDYRRMSEVARLLTSLRESGQTIYVITHDPEFICACCTDILHLSAGSVAAWYPMDEAGVQKIRDFFRVSEIQSEVEKNPPILMADSFRIHSKRISDMATTILIKALKMRRMLRLCEYWLEFLFFGAQHTGRQRFPGTCLFLRAKREPDDLHFHHAVADLRKETEKAADRRNPQIVVAEHIAAAGHLQTTIPRG